MRDLPSASAFAKKQETSFGLIVPFDSPELVEIAGVLGFDFVMIDGEHGFVDAAMALRLIRAAEGADLASIVRVGSHLSHEVLKYLDIGAGGIMFPRVQSRGDAEHVAATVRFPPAGSRGLAPGVRAARFGTTPVADYMLHANQTVKVLPIIETKEGVDAIEDILSVAGIDIVTLGPTDLSASMGYLGDTSVAEVSHAVKKVAEACRHHGKPLLLAASTLPQITAAVGLGASLVMLPFAGWLIHMGRDFLQSARRQAGG